MYRLKFKALLPVVATVLLVGIPSAWAQVPIEAKQSTTDITRNQSRRLSLKDAFELAWNRQPEARSQTVRQEAVRAARAAALSWTIEPPALQLQAKSDRMGSNTGNGEYEIGLAVPLWLPGERSRSGALAEAQAKAMDSQFMAAQLRVAEIVRERWWNYYRAEGELALAEERHANALTLIEDVARRFKAGDLSRADMHQANGLVALTDTSLIEARGNRDVALNVLRSLIGMAFSPDTQAIQIEPIPDSKTLNESANHPVLLEFLDRAAVAWRVAELASVRTRANPEIVIATTKSRAATGERTYTLGVRIPFGAGSQAEAKRATAKAEALDVESSVELERSRIVATIESARAQVIAAQGRLTAAETRAHYARESQGFFEKSFRLGESDLPTRLRIEFEATEAERQLNKTRIDVAAAISSLRQSVGLLPE